MIPLPIETARLTIRSFVAEDVDRVTVIFTDPVVMEYISLRDKTVPELIADYEQRYAERGYSFWAICDRDGRVVGDVGFGTYEPTGDPELGWTLAQEVWGRGYATEAAAACIEALFAHTRHNRIIALVDTRNVRSLRTAARLGMRAVAEVEHPLHRHMLFEVMRP